MRRAPIERGGYPVVPAIYIALAGLLVVALGFLAPATSGIGYLIVLTGVPVYLVWRRRAASAV
jgi:APA family basic amino acid/polyamine antiporter